MLCLSIGYFCVGWLLNEGDPFTLIGGDNERLPGITRGHSLQIVSPQQGSGKTCDRRDALNYSQSPHLVKSSVVTHKLNFARLGSVGYAQTGYYPTKNFCEFCRTFILVPGTSGSSVRQCHKYPGYGYIIFTTYVSSVRPCHNTLNFCEFCNTSIPYPEFL